MTMTEAAMPGREPTRHPGGLKDVLTLAIGGASFDELLDGLLQAARGFTGAAARAALCLLDDSASSLRME